MTLGDLIVKFGADKTELTNALDSIPAQAEAASAKTVSALDRITAGIEKTAQTAHETGMVIVEATVKMAELATGAAVAYLAVTKAIQGVTAVMGAYAAAASAATTSSEALANSYRAIRLALSPTVFTAGTLALGILVEKTVEAAVETEKLIEVQGALAARTKQSFVSISALAEAEKQLGVAAGSFKLLGIDNIETAIPKLKELANIAEQFKGIEDPIARAALAFKLWGDDAEKILPLVSRDLKTAAENAFDLSRQLDQPTRESLFRIRTAFDDFVNFFKSGWRSISLESSDMWHSIEMGAIKALTSIESGVHQLSVQMGADFRGAGLQLEGILTNLPKLLPSGGAGGFEPGMGLAGPSQGGVGAVTPSALELTNQAKELGTALVSAMMKPKLPAEALDATFRHLGLTAEELAAAAKKAAAELAAAFSTVGVIDFEREIENLNSAWNTLADRGRINADVLDAYNRRMQELSDKVPGVTQAYLNLGLQQDALARGWKDITNGLSETGLSLDKTTRQIAAAHEAMQTWQTGTLATISTALTDVTQNVNLLHYSMERLGQVFGDLQQIGVDSFKAIKGSILETSEIMEGMGLKSTIDLRTEATRLGDEYQRLIELQREGKASTLDVAGAYDKWTEAEMKVAGMSRTLSTEQQQALRDVRQAINSVSSSLADSIIHWKGFENVGITALEAIGKAILKNVIQHFLDATGLVDKLLAGVGTVLSKIGLGGLSGAAGAATAKAAGGAASSASSAASQAGSAASSSGGSALSTGLGIAGLGVSVASGIAQGIQGAQMVHLLGEIEISTRQCKEQLTGGIQTSLNTYLPNLLHLVDIWDALVNGPLQDIDDMLRYGSIHVTTDMSDIIPAPGTVPGQQVGNTMPAGGETPASTFAQDLAFNGVAADVKSISRNLLNPPVIQGQQTAWNLNATQGAANAAALALHSIIHPEDVHQSTFDERVTALLASWKDTLAAGGKVGGVGSNTYNPVANIAEAFGVTLQQAQKIFDADAAKQPEAWRATIDPNLRKFNEGLITSEELLKLQAEAMQRQTDILQDPAHAQAAAQAAALADAQKGLIPATTAYQQAQRDLTGSTLALQQQVNALQQSFWASGGSPQASAALTAQVNGMGSSVALQAGFVATGDNRGPSADAKNQAVQQYAAQLQALAAMQDQQTAEANASLSTMTDQGNVYRNYVTYAGENSSAGRAWKEWGQSIPKSMAELIQMNVDISNKELFGQLSLQQARQMRAANNTAYEAFAKAKLLGTAVDDGSGRFVSPIRSLAASPINYAASLANYAANLNTQWTTSPLPGQAGLPFGANSLSGQWNQLALSSRDLSGVNGGSIPSSSSIPFFASGGGSSQKADVYVTAVNPDGRTIVRGISEGLREIGVKL